MSESLDHARREPILRIGAGGVADHSFVVGQLIIEKQRVRPIEPSHSSHCILHRSRRCLGRQYDGSSTQTVAFDRSM